MLNYISHIKINRLLIVWSSLIVFIAGQSEAGAQTARQDRIIHNGNKGLWGNNPKAALVFINKIGSFDSRDENYNFYVPSDIVVDKNGNIYILDTGNHRIQKFDMSGKYLATLGEKGQGPVEFNMPYSLDIDDENRLIICDQGNLRIQVLNTDGKSIETVNFSHSIGTIRQFSTGDILMGGAGMFSGLLPGSELEEQPGLVRLFTGRGESKGTFGIPLNYNDIMLNLQGNKFHFTIDKYDNVYLAFNYQNRIDKYSPEGELLLKIDRKLNYDTTPPLPDKDNLDVSSTGAGRRVTMMLPHMKDVSSGIAVDSKDRIWVVTAKRQISKNERIFQNYNVNTGGSGHRDLDIKVFGNTEITETDMYELQIFRKDGKLLWKLPLDHFADDIRIFNDRLFILDKYRGMNYYEYRIVDR